MCFIAVVAAPREVEEPCLQRHVGGEKCDAAKKPPPSHFSLVPIIGAVCAVKPSMRAGASTALQWSHSRVFSVHTGLNIQVPLREGKHRTLSVVRTETLNSFSVKLLTSSRFSSIVPESSFCSVLKESAEDREHQHRHRHRHHHRHHPKLREDSLNMFSRRTRQLTKLSKSMVRSCSL